MRLSIQRSRKIPAALAAASALLVALFLVSQPITRAQQADAPAVPQEQQASAQPSTPSSSSDEVPGGITEDQLKQMLVGKTFYLRGGYLDPTLTFNEHGKLASRSPEGSFTLSLIEIDRVRLARHKVELDGVRYGLHFLGALPYEDPANAYDKVRITPKNKMVRISIDRELVVKPKKAKAAKPSKSARNAKPAPVPTKGVQAAPVEDASSPELSDADEIKTEIAAAPVAERPVDPKSMTTTTSPAHATEVLKDALDVIFAPSIDDRMMATMPEFWKLYYQAAAAKSDFRPADASILRQNTVDQKARLVTNFEPESNQFAQDGGVAGAALYHTVIGADGKPQQIAVGRPIGFGLDENAVKAIRDAKFEPAIKDGKPVPVLVDLVVQFRIFSKRTAVGTSETADHSDQNNSTQGSKLPGPYSLHTTME